MSFCCLQAVQRDWAQRAYISDLSLDISAEVKDINQQALAYARNEYANSKVVVVTWLCRPRAFHVLPFRRIPQPLALAGETGRLFVISATSGAQS